MFIMKIAIDNVADGKPLNEMLLIILFGFVIAITLNPAESNAFCLSLTCPLWQCQIFQHETA